MPRNDTDWEALDWGKADIQLAVATGKSKNCVSFHRRRLKKPRPAPGAGPWWTRNQFGKGYGR